MKDRFGAFIMTYNRPLTVIGTIRKLMCQTIAPEYILVVDNSEGNDTEVAISSLNKNTVGYCRTGYNSGPAGAAAIGLQRMQQMGFDWILWGDDDDPPASDTAIENVFHILSKYELDPEVIGVLGSLGGKLNRKTGRTLNFSNSELHGLMDADYIPGNKLMIVNRRVMEKGVYPSPDLFFGFEELDFCLKVKSAGLRVAFDGAALLESRRARGNADGNYRWKGKSMGDQNVLWRQYYSTRNLLYVLKKNGLLCAVIYLMGRSVIKSLYGFRYGARYGSRQFVVQWSAILDFMRGVKGRVIM